MSPNPNISDILKRRVNHILGLVGFLQDTTSSYLKGAAEAPFHIREAFACFSSNQWSELGFRVGDYSKILDCGDWRFEGDNYNLEIEGIISTMVRSGLIPISLGGDHSITFPIVKGLKSYHNRINVLHLKQHSEDRRYPGKTGHPLGFHSPPVQPPG